MTPTAYNGTYTVTAVSGNDVSYAKTGNPGSATVMGTLLNYGSFELEAMVKTFFAQGTSTPVSVMEVGNVLVAAGVDVLEAYQLAHPDAFYGYLVPRLWADAPDYVTHVNAQTSNTAKTYYFTTVDSGNYTDFATMKSVAMFVEGSNIAATEFVAAMGLYNFISHKLSQTSKMTSANFSFAYGLTEYDGTPTEKANWQTANVSFIDSAAEGGLTNKMLRGGNFGDARPFSYWYAIDWAQINSQLVLANEIINGSNNSANPLYYDQNGIERLQKRLVTLLDLGQTLGLIDFIPRNGDNPSLPDITAIPYIQYLRDFPSDVAAGAYNGLAVSFRVKGFFVTITLNLIVTDFATA
jgi:hypothetical protein